MLQVPDVWQLEERDVQLPPGPDPGEGQLPGQVQVHHEVSDHSPHIAGFITYKLIKWYF